MWMWIHCFQLQWNFPLLFCDTKFPQIFIFLSKTKTPKQKIWIDLLTPQSNLSPNFQSHITNSSHILNRTSPPSQILFSSLKFFTDNPWSEDTHEIWNHSQTLTESSSHSPIEPHRNLFLILLFVHWNRWWVTKFGHFFTILNPGLWLIDTKFVYFSSN